MTDLQACIQAAVARYNAIGNYQTLVRDVFEAGEKCGIPPGVWRDDLPRLVGDFFRPFIEGARNAADKNYHMVVIGLFFRQMGMLSEAERWLRPAAEAAAQIDDLHVKCNAFQQYGTLLRLSGRIPEALGYLRRAAEVVHQVDSPVVQVNVYREYGVALGNAGRGDEALPYLKRAADAADRTDDLPTRCSAYQEYGELLRITGQPVGALVYLGRAVDAAEQLGDAHSLCGAYGRYGALLEALGRPAEASTYSERAVGAAGHHTEPLARCNAALRSARFHFSLKRFDAALARFRLAQKHLQGALAANHWPRGISTVLGSYSEVFDHGLCSADRVFRETKVPDVLFHGVSFADGLKAVSVREGLRRHASRRIERPVDEWSPGPTKYSELFADPAVARPAHPTGVAPRRSLRASRIGAPVHERPPTALELPEDVDPAKDELSVPIDELDLAGILPDGITVAVVFHFLNDDLCILPIRRGPTGKPVVLHNGEGYACLRGVRPKLNELLALQEGTLAAIKDLGWHADGAAKLRARLEDERRAGGFDLAAVPIGLGQLLRLDELLALVEPNPAKWPNLHLVLLPDGPLYQLPLHAAAVMLGDKQYTHLIDLVRSVRYALSLRTLHTLGKVEADEASKWPGGVPLRGAAFVNPSGQVGDDVHGERLTFATLEVEHLVGQSPKHSWRLFGECGPDVDRRATRATMRRFHSTPTLLWSVCHGGLMPDTFLPRGFTREQTVVNPSLLLTDGPVSTARMVSEGYDLRGVLLWHNSCCLLGRLESPDSHRQVEGYVAALTLLGCRRVTSAMWELDDHAAADFARHFLARLRANVFDNPDRSPHAVAVSLKEALGAFRRDKTNGDFNHPYYWAPYTLYGLG